jgi:uncharacterized membrane protein YdjX (TVP38/TMEM64 family)
VRRINPIFLLIAFNIILFVFRDVLLPEDVLARTSAAFEVALAGLGIFGYVGIVALYGVCAFFFIPLLIPLNILCGALYGPYVGTGVSLAGITLGSAASTVSVRHVFRGMETTMQKRPSAQRVIQQFARHGAVAVIVARLAFIVPYLFQNIALAITPIGLWRLTWLTAIGSLPSAAIYSFLGAGFVQSESIAQLALYLAVPLVLLVVISFAYKRLNSNYDAD